jgi:hypothetical protein
MEPKTISQQILAVHDTQGRFRLDTSMKLHAAFCNVVMPKTLKHGCLFTNHSNTAKPNISMLIKLPTSRVESMGMQNQTKRTIAHILNIMCSVYFPRVLLGLKYGRGLIPTAKVSNRNIYEIAEKTRQ